MLEDEQAKIRRIMRYQDASAMLGASLEDYLKSIKAVNESFLSTSEAARNFAKATLSEKKKRHE